MRNQKGVIVKAFNRVCIFLFVLIFGFVFKSYAVAPPAEETPTASKEVLTEAPTKVATEVESVTFVDDTGVSVNVGPTTKDSLYHQVNTNFDSEKLIKDIHNLRNTFPEYSKIVVEINPSDNSSDDNPSVKNNWVNVVFTFQRKRLVGSLRIVIPPGVTPVSDLREKLKTQGGDYLDGALIEKDKEIIRKIYQTMGYPNVEVKSTVNKYESDDVNDANKRQVSVEYFVEPNSPKVYVKNIDFTDNKKFSDRKLKNQVSHKPNLLFFLNVLNLEDLDNDLYNIIQLYKDEGFNEVQASYKLSNIDSGQATVTFHINEGPYREIKQINLSGVTKFSEAVVREAMNLDEGSPFSEKRLQMTLRKIKEFYGQTGYVMAQATSSFDTNSGVLDLQVEENQPYTVDKIVVKGNYNMDQKLILNEISFSEGELIDSSKIAETTKNLKQTGFYRDVQAHFIPNENPEQLTGTIEIQVQELQEQTFTFGAGYGEELFGTLSYQNNNFEFSGRSFYLDVEKGKETSKLALVFNDPYIFDSKYSMTLRAQYAKKSFSSFEQSSLGGSLVISSLVQNNLKLGLGTRIDLVDIEKASEELLEIEPDAVGERTVSGLIGTFVYNKEAVDDKDVAYDGHKIKMTLYPSYADDELYFKSFAAAVKHLELFEQDSKGKHVLTGKITLSHASEKSPFYERFHGSKSIKGLNKTARHPTNGYSYTLSGGGYYSFPIDDEIFRGVLFAEAVQLGNDDISDVRVVGGAGVRANLRNSFLGTSIEGGFLVPLKEKTGDEFKPYYFVFGSDSGYDL